MSHGIFLVVDLERDKAKSRQGYGARNSLGTGLAIVSTSKQVINRVYL